jgi:hypothetical protein
MHALAREGVKTIGTNRVLRTFVPTWLLIADLIVLAEEETRLHSAKPGLLTLHGLAVEAEEKMRGLDVWTFWVGEPFMPKPRLPYLGCELSWKHGRLVRTGNTGTYALEAAALMGFTEIRLLGIDLRFDLAKSHFYGVNKHRGHRIRHKPSHIRRVVQSYGALHDILADHGVRVVNESPIEGPLDEVLPKEKSPWLKQP